MFCVLSWSYFNNTIALPGSSLTLPWLSDLTHFTENSGKFNSGTILLSSFIEVVPFVSIDNFVVLDLNQPNVAAIKDIMSVKKLRILL